jgi:hypothetical protein
MWTTAVVTLRVGLGIVLGSSVLLASGLPTYGQVARPTPLEDLQTKDGSDFFNGRGNNQSGSVMNFIQNAIIGAPRSMEEFQSEQQGNFNDAASQFRKLQAEQLRKQQGQSNPAPANVPASTGTTP